MGCLTKESRVLFLLCSAREGGNTETLARRAAMCLPDSCHRDWIRLRDHPLAEFADIRHVGDGTYPPAAGSAGELLALTLSATDLVFVCPLYWYGPPSLAKTYLDHWSAWMRIPGVDFRSRMKHKKLWAICVYSGDDPVEAAPLFETLRLTAEYMGMEYGPTVLGRGNRPGDVLNDTEALSSADKLFRG